MDQQPPYTAEKMLNAAGHRRVVRKDNGCGSFQGTQAASGMTPSS